MFLQVSVCPHGGGHITDGGVCPGGVLYTPKPTGRHPRDDHRSGRYASYWNAFLFGHVIYDRLKDTLMSCDLPADLHLSDAAASRVASWVITPVCCGTGSLLQRSPTDKTHIQKQGVFSWIRKITR